MARAINPGDGFNEKLLKLIPSEIVAAYLFVQNIVGGEILFGDEGSTVNLAPYILWAVFGILLVLTPLYLMKLQKVKFGFQSIYTTFAFVVWVYTLGEPGPFAQWYIPQVASVLLLLMTLLMPLIVRNPATQPSDA